SSLTPLLSSFLFFFPPPPTPEIYTLSLHDALPISVPRLGGPAVRPARRRRAAGRDARGAPRSPVDTRVRTSRAPRAHARAGGGSDRKSTRLNSSHVKISYAVFCLKKKK